MVHITVLAVTTLAFGWMVDAWVFSDGTLGLLSGTGGLPLDHGQEQISPMASAAAVVLLALIGAALWRGAREQGALARAAG